MEVTRLTSEQNITSFYCYAFLFNTLKFFFSYLLDTRLPIEEHLNHRCIRKAFSIRPLVLQGQLVQQWANRED